MNFDSLQRSSRYIKVHGSSEAEFLSLSVMGCVQIFTFHHQCQQIKAFACNHNDDEHCETEMAKKNRHAGSALQMLHMLAKQAELSKQNICWSSSFSSEPLITIALWAD